VIKLFNDKNDISFTFCDDPHENFLADRLLEAVLDSNPLQMLCQLFARKSCQEHVGWLLELETPELLLVVRIHLFDFFHHLNS
jgi:hypothetical protein